MTKDKWINIRCTEKERRHITEQAKVPSNREVEITDYGESDPDRFEFTNGEYSAILNNDFFERVSSDDKRVHTVTFQQN